MPNVRAPQRKEGYGTQAPEQRSFRGEQDEDVPGASGEMI